MAQIIDTAARIDPREARQHLASGALLVCAYDDPKKFAQYRLDEAMSFDDFAADAQHLPKDQEIIFYCA